MLRQHKRECSSPSPLGDPFSAREFSNDFYWLRGGIRSGHPREIGEFQALTAKKALRAV